MATTTTKPSGKAPNPYRDPRPWGEVKIGGVLIKADLVAIDGNEVEDEYNVQRPIGQSGAVAVFKGTKIAESIQLTFEAPDEASFDDLADLWALLAPKPGTLGGNAATPTTFTAAAQNPTGDPNATPTGTLPTGTGASTNADGWPKNPAMPNPGPKPPTLTIENPALAWIGVTAISRKKWKGPSWRADVGSWRVDLTVIQAKPPTPANTGAQSVAKGDGFVGNKPTDAADAAAQGKATGAQSPV